jgi:hypothetical protein
MKKVLAKIYALLPALLATPVYAQGNPPTFEGNVGAIIRNLLRYLFPIAGLLALIFIIVGGYMWIVSGGDPGRVKQAQGTLTWAILGLIIVMVIFGILRAVLGFLS